MYIGLHVQYPLFLPDFNETWNFSIDFRKILKYQISWKSVHLGVALFPADGQTDGRTDRLDEDSSPFPQFCKRA